MEPIVRVTLLGVIALVFSLGPHVKATENATDEAAGREYMKTLNDLLAKEYNKYMLAYWAYDSNLTDYNEDQETKASLELAAVSKEAHKKVIAFPWQNFTEPELLRMFKGYAKLGTPALSEEKYGKLTDAINNMVLINTNATICGYKNKTNCDQHEESGVDKIFETSTDAEELKYTWVEWQKAAGSPARGNFSVYVDLENEAAKLNGYDSVAEWWLSVYETPDIEDQLMAMWAQIKPLYQQMHAYVRRYLRLTYGEDVVSARGPIPAHLMNWKRLEKYTMPYPNKTEVNVTEALLAQNFTPLKIVQSADEFYQSLNFSALPDTFWNRSIIERPSDGREMVCFASSWDFYDGEDFRIKQCTEITDEYYYKTHSEMGHIEYFIQYSHQPVVFRNGASPAFQEAIGDTIALSVSSPKHLKRMAIVEDLTIDEETLVNLFYKTLLGKVGGFPMSYMIDVYRYDVFRGTTTPDDYNCHYWQYREGIEGIEPPATRTEEDFDPASIYHIAADVETMRYFISFIIQFQFHKALCTLAGEFKTGDNSTQLSNCDIYNSTTAGNVLKQMLQLGSSKPWPDAMELLTGQRNMDAKGVLEYFQPIYEWLKAENEKNGEFIGWESSNVTFCTPEQRTRMESSGFNERVKKYSVS